MYVLDDTLSLKRQRMSVESRSTGTEASAIAPTWLDLACLGMSWFTLLCHNLYLLGSACNHAIICRGASATHHRVSTGLLFGRLNVRSVRRLWTHQSQNRGEQLGFLNFGIW